MDRLLVGMLGCLWASLAGSLPAAAQTQPLRYDLSESPCSGTEAAAFSPDGKLLASVRERGLLALWDTTTGTLLTSADRVGEVNSYVTPHGLAFSPDGKTIAVGVASGVGTTGDIFLWKVKDGTTLELTAMLNKHVDGVLALAFSPDATSLVSAGDDGLVRIWDVAAGRPRLVLSGHRQRILALAVSADGRTLVTGDPGEIKVWDPMAGTETASWPVVDLIDLALSPDGKSLAVSSFPEGGITFWDVATGTQLTDVRPLPDNMSPMAFSPDGESFVSVNRDRTAPATVTVSSLAEARVLARYTYGGSHVHVAAFSPDGTLLATGDYDERAAARLQFMDVSSLISDQD